MEDATTPTSYAAQWSEYRRRQRTLVAVSALFIPTAVLGVIASSFHWPAFIPTAIGIAWFVATAVAGMWASIWPCPKCGNYFFRAGLFQNGFARRCLHCGLPKWSKH